MNPLAKQIFAQAAAGLILAAAGGVGFLVYNVPRQLDLVLQNQRTMAERFSTVARRLDRAEQQLDGLNTRVSRMERP